jgi:hypothetical protein
MGRTKKRKRKQCDFRLQTKVHKLPQGSGSCHRGANPVLRSAARTIPRLNNRPNKNSKRSNFRTI